MPENYYQNILYPLQDKILRIIEKIRVKFYLTGGTALSRAYLDHRYSDDLDFFLNNANDFKQQVALVIEALKINWLKLETSVADEGFARVFINENNCTLKIDFVNDIPFRSGKSINTKIYLYTDNIENILSNKLTALSRYTAKDIVDIVFISLKHSFSWPVIFSDATEKDMWVNPIEVCNILDGFPVQKLNEIKWIHEISDRDAWFSGLLEKVIRDILEGTNNSLNVIPR